MLPLLKATQNHRFSLKIHAGPSYPNFTNNYFSSRFSISLSAGKPEKREPPSESELIERKEREKEYRRQWNKNNKEKRKVYDRQFYERHKEEKKESSRQYQEKNKEKIKESKRLKNEKNPGKKNEIFCRWKEKIGIKEYNLRKNEKAKEKRKEVNCQLIVKKKQIDPNYVHVPRKNWKDKESVKSFFEKLGKVLEIKSLSDWYNVSNPQIRKNGGRGALGSHKSLGFALKFAYPKYPWDMGRFQTRGKTAAQRWLFLVLKGLLSKDTVIEYNFRKDPALKWEGLKFPSQFDIYIKALRLALEYQGEQHYMDIPGRDSLSDRQKKDNDKLASCVKHGITLVRIHYWWDMKSDSLSSTLHQYMPDIFPKTSSPPIPNELPADYQKVRKPGYLTNIHLMNGYDFKPYENEINVEGWFMSEKLDGIRAYWDGENFLSKNNKIINVPESFKQLPPYPLDGELWGGYEDNESFLIPLKLSCGPPRVTKLDWTNIKFCVFDAPQVEGTYDKRHLFLKNNLHSYFNSNISLIPMLKCSGKEHLENQLEEIVKKGGEGIILYNPISFYQPGRNKNVLKVKKYYESKITFLERSEISYHFHCQQDNGTKYWLKVTGGYYDRHPEVGSEIPVIHQGFFANSQKFKYPVLYELESSKQATTKKQATAKRQAKAQAKKQAKKQEKNPNININE